MPNDISPGPVSRRIEELDLLRGFAVFGILVANMAQYFLPDLFSDTAISIRGTDDADVLSWIGVHAFVDNKFLTLFSLLFGVSFALLGQSLADRGGGKAILSRRLSVLLMFGLIHGVFFYYADILVGYALAAFLLWPMLALRPRTQLIVGIVLLGVVAGPWRYLVSGPDPGAPTLTELRDTAKRELSAALDENIHAENGDPASSASPFSSEEVAAAWEEIQAYSVGPMSVSLSERLEHLIPLFVAVIAYVLWRSLGLFLIGAAIYRSGWLTGKTPRDWRRYALLFLPLGLIVNVGVSILLYRNDVSPGPLTRELAVMDEAAALLLALGYASLVFWFAKSVSLRWLTARVASVGRTALSNYIGQSVVMAVVATHYGLSLFGELSRAATIVLAVAFFALQIVLSHGWMQHFRYGPLEWIWRCISYWTILPIRQPRQSRPGP